MGGSDIRPTMASGAPVRPGHRLRTLWCRRSRESGWDPPDDWWTPAVDAVCAAAAEGTDMSTGCARFGQARARSGVTISAALDDFAALADVLGWPSPPMELVKALAEGWVDAGRSHDDCTDPLTGLSTAAYLRTRLGELFQEAAPDLTPAVSHRLIVVALDPSIDPWRRTARLIVLGHELRQFFVRGESVALLSRGRIAVLAPAALDLADRVERLRADVGREHGADVWNVPLPDSHEGALALLNDVGQPP